MGNAKAKESSQKLIQEVRSYEFTQIAKSYNKSIISFYIDEEQLPTSGYIAIGIQGSFYF